MKTLPPRPARLAISLLARDIQATAQSGIRIQSYRGKQALLPRPFGTSLPHSQNNRVFTPFRTPPQFHDALRLISANNTLMLTLFTTSSCTPCRTITPLLKSLVETRLPTPEDKYSHLAFAELELDSPDMSNGKMLDLGVEYGVSSMPTLIGFGGRRAERVTERIVDTRMLCDQRAVAKWIDEEMKKGDPFPSQGGGSGFLGRLFGS